MSQLKQIKEEDLSELERALPNLAEAFAGELPRPLRVQLRHCQTILSNVRWNYGPHTDVEIIPSDDQG
ncbi:MAG: hypothetical protein AAGH88_00740 [Planctomycetota bacterium]